MKSENCCEDDVRSLQRQTNKNTQTKGLQRFLFKHPTFLSFEVLTVRQIDRLTN